MQENQIITVNNNTMKADDKDIKTELYRAIVAKYNRTKTPRTVYKKDYKNLTAFERWLILENASISIKLARLKDKTIALCDEVDSTVNYDNVYYSELADKVNDIDKLLKQ